MNVGDTLASRFLWLIQQVREGQSVNGSYLAPFVAGYASALEEADTMLGKVDREWRVSWEFQIPQGRTQHPDLQSLPVCFAEPQHNQEWYWFELKVKRELEARMLVSNEYPVPIRRKVHLQFWMGNRWITVPHEGDQR